MFIQVIPPAPGKISYKKVDSYRNPGKEVEKKTISKGIPFPQRKTYLLFSPEIRKKGTKKGNQNQILKNCF